MVSVTVGVERLYEKYKEKPRWWVFGSTKHQNRALPLKASSKALKPGRFCGKLGTLDELAHGFVDRSDGD
jgi:hypothetical protein